MRLSFIVPTRNQARFLRTCLDSILAQGIADAEILVLDGASTDDTVSVLREYDGKVRWTSAPDRGQADAVNQGVARAKGEIIAWLNSDDYYADDGVLRRVLAAFDADPSLDIVYGDGVMVDTRAQPIRPYRSKAIHDARDILFTSLGPLLQPCVFFKKSLFDAVGGLDTALHYVLDYDMWIRMWRRGVRSRYLRQPLACAVYHADAKSVRSMPRQIAEALVVKRRHAASLGLGATERLRMYAGVGSLCAYYAAVRLGLKRAV
jgi:glycosyltransferase involved in cell wall biosynthesis